MKTKQSVIFIGSINLGDIADDGETMKNRMIINVLRKYIDKVYIIDVRNKPNRLLYLLKLVFLLVFKRNCKIIVSASALVAYSLIKVISLLKYDMNKVYYWVIGGRFDKYIQNGDIDKKYYQRIHTVIVEGDCMRRSLNSAELTNVITLRNFKEIKYIPPKNATNSDILKFVFISRIIPEKGVLYICKAVKLLESMGIDNFQVDFYGKIQPSFKSEFMNEISNNSKLKYTGFLDLTEKEGYDILSKYDIMLFPTYWPSEGFPGVIVDAFISGVPVIASDWNLNKTIIEDRKDGFIIPVHNIEALVETMKYVINNRTEIRNMGKELQKQAMLYDTDMVVSKELLSNIGLIN